VIPKPAPEGSSAALQADRAYQVAAAYFYSANFEQAAAQFQAIAADNSSPWRATSAYLLARCSIRMATLENKPESMSQAESRLDAILHDDSMKQVHPAARSMLDFVRARLDPERRLHELAQSVLAKNAPPALTRDFNDYLFLFYKRDNAKEPLDDLTGWLATFRAPMTASDHVIQRWRETQSLPWLIAALTQAKAGAASLPELLQAAGKIRPDSPAYATVAFHMVRLLEESRQTDEARKQLDVLLAQQSSVPMSARNLFLSERTRIAESWEAFLKYAPRLPVGEGYDYDSESADFASNPQLKAFAGARPVFDADTSTILNEQIPLARLKDAATDAALPATLRSGIALAAWTRAILLGNDALSDELAPVVQKLIPELRQPVAAYIDAHDRDAKRFEAIFLMLKNPGTRPYIETGFGRLTPLAKVDNLRDNWWCTLGAPEENFEFNYYKSRSRLSTPLAMLYGNSKPEAAFLSPADRLQAQKEWKSLAALATAPTLLSQEAVSYLRAHSDDPRAPEALALAVRSTRYGCGDSGTTKQSQAAFRLLHSRYPNSEWAKKTKYYY
jgi:hypothetical protein